ncbi:lytic polysaccharide monooxygenase [Vibrio pacinii]|uniref:lytic polysaccharide monooxygenase n=1 Tax=Vibrio pacinii TaxID=170674 RepID=UPI000570CED7|nr:lytic polysaccharide monooxygenase [Vibrio pacinii]
MKIYTSLSLLGLSTLAGLSTFHVSAHGWVEFPNARQNICYQDGGFWTNEIPNPACQAAFDQSGAYPFVQRSEVSANVANYRDMAHVQAIVRDGELCSAGDSAKAGLNVVSSHWQRTDVALDENNQIDFVFYGKAPHNPSYWQFYLTKANYDSSQPLTWNDLELIDSAGNIAIDEQKRYRTKVTFPAGRSGDAILYTRWQRVDAAGEGFYNCSDITLRGSGTPPTDPTDPSDPANNLTALGYFVPQGFGPVEAGDTIRFRTFDASGAEIVDLSLAISANNTTTWAAEMADQFNSQQNGDWYVGIWHQEMKHYMFDSNNIYANQVLAPNDSFSYALSLIKAGTPPPTEPDNLWRKEAVYNAGDVVTHNGREWTAQWWTTGEEPGSTGEWGVWR